MIAAVGTLANHGMQNSCQVRCLGGCGIITICIINLLVVFIMPFGSRQTQRTNNQSFLPREHMRGRSWEGGSKSDFFAF